MEAGLEIVDPNTMTDFQANFETHKDSISHDSLSVFFEDISLGEDIVSWYWDFGDGSSAMGPVSHHIYNEPGIYDVSLTVSTEPLINDFRTSTIVKKVYAGMREYFDFGGHAFAGYFPVDIGTAYLYKIEEDEFIPIDTTHFDTLGFYYFPTLIEGDYKVKAFPSTESVNAGKYLPTYYENSLLWTKAKTIKLDVTGWEYDIHMVENFDYGTGAGSIDGVVALDGGKTFDMKDVEIILFNENNQCLTYIKSDEAGSFEFIQLAYGTYQVMAEVPGMFTYPTTITISEENPVIEDISILVYDEEIPFGIGDDITKLAGLGNLYPNPARDHVILPFELKENRQLQFFVINQCGQVIEKSTGFYHAGDHQVQINTAALLPGMYRIMVLAENEKHIRAFVKAH